MNVIADRYRKLVTVFEDRVDAVTAEQWANPSPCDGWTARDVVRHMVDVHGMMLRMADRSLSPAPSVDVDPAAALRAARADVEAVVADPEILDRPYDSFFGPTTVGATVDRFLGFDFVVHGWDLARATGQEEHIEADEVDRAMSDAHALGDSLRSPGVCAGAVALPAGASAQDELLAFLGRDPRPA